MHKLTIIVLCLTVCAGTAQAQMTDLMITEYVEGSGDNKALEIFNGTEDVINLGGYTLERYSNGTTVAVTITPDAVDLESGDAWVITNPLADAELMLHSDQTDADINFSGNDAIVLVFGGSTIIDSLGRVGEDPGSYWTCAGGNTANHTLRRLSSICTGDTVVDDVFDPCDEWSFAPIDSFNWLGDHIADCGAVANETTSWSQMKATFR